MNRLLTIAGGLAITYLVVGSRVTSAIYDRIEYSLANISLRDIKPDFVEGRLTVMLDLKLFMRQSFGVALSLRGIDLNFSQLGNNLGHIRANQAVTLPHGTSVAVPLTLSVQVSGFANHLMELVGGKKGSPLAPIKISGKAYLSNGQVIPISTFLNFISVG